MSEDFAGVDDAHTASAHNIGDTPNSTGQDQPPSKLHVAARALAVQGIPVFPVVPGTKFPAIKRWTTEATTDLNQIDAWWAKADYNIGVVPEFAGWCVIDIDVKGDGEITIRKLETEHGALPNTLTIRTPSGGRHLYFTGSLRATQGVSGLGPGIDTRGRLSFVVVPPSQIDGTEYTVEPDVAKTPVPVPTWIVEKLQRTWTAPKAADPDVQLDTPVAIERAREAIKRAPIAGPDEEGNDYALFARCKDMGISQEKLLELLIERGSKVADQDWLEFTIGNAWRYGQNEPGSDYRNPAERFAGYMPTVWRSHAELHRSTAEPVAELIAGLLEKHRVGYLIGVGGVHKSRIAAHWGLAVHTGTPVYGRQVQQAHFMHLSWTTRCPGARLDLALASSIKYRGEPRSPSSDWAE
jgi:hypothetical protein